MTLETLERANAVKKTIDKLENEKIRISKLFSIKERLTTENIDELIQIAMVNTDYTLKSFKNELNEM